MAVNLTTLFTRWGKMLFALNTLNTARLTTVPDEIQDVLDEFASASAAILSTVDNLPDAIPAWQSGTGSIATELQASFQALLVQMVKDDNVQPDDALLTAYDELLRQMDASSDTVDASVVAGTATADAGNTGTGAFLVSVKRGDGRSEENLYAEDVRFICTARGESATFSFAGEPTVDYLSEQWPDGSGCSGSVTVITSDDSLADNGGFEDEDDISDVPDGWEVIVGTPGTTFRITEPEVQTVVISGTPTLGTYALVFTNAAGKVQITGPLDFDADGGTVQAALNALIGAEGWTIDTTGTSPNYTHTITMLDGPGGNVTQLSSMASATFNGTIGHATTTVGGESFRGSKSLEFIGGATLNAIQIPLADLTAATAYACNIWAKVSSVPGAGDFRICLWDGSAVVNDDQGVANSLTVNCPGLTTNWAAQKVMFQTPSVMPPVLYLRIELTTALSGGVSLYLDELAFDAADLLYIGGPNAKLFSGSTQWEVADAFTLAMTNDRAGEFQTGVFRAIQSPERLLPSNAAAGETISDALVS